MKEIEAPMKRVNRIITHLEYQECYDEIQSLEADRKFCRHGMEHFLDVARLAYIIAREEGNLLDQEVIYAAALLHDIGRHLQYTKGIPHHEGSARIAARILPASGFSQEEQEIVIGAIYGHSRGGHAAGSFSELLYRADKLSRNCFLCPAQKECNWSRKKQNSRIIY